MNWKTRRRCITIGVVVLVVGMGTFGLGVSGANEPGHAPSAMAAGWGIVLAALGSGTLAYIGLTRKNDDSHGC